MCANGETLAMIVGRNISTRRRVLGLTQERLAEMVGVGQQSLSRMEKGRISPKFDRLQIFANALGCTVADLFAEDGRLGEVSLNEIIRPLSADSQRAIIKIVTDLAQVMLKLERQ